jgi:hypothetical protein
MNLFDLPADCWEFLRASKELEYDPSACEPGMVVLKKPDELSLDKVYVRTKGLSFAEDDPHRSEDGYYVIRAVALVRECQAYRPKGVLIWLPDYKAFGQWDDDHQVVTYFPQVSWSTIAAGPAHYLNAMWDSRRGVGSLLVPWEKGVFTPERRTKKKRAE